MAPRALEDLLHLGSSEQPHSSRGCWGRSRGKASRLRQVIFRVEEYLQHFCYGEQCPESGLWLRIPVLITATPLDQNSQVS